MKITAVTSLYRPHVGGVETMVEEMAYASQNAGHELQVITKQWPSELPIEESINDVSVCRVPTGITEDELLSNAATIRDRSQTILTNTDALHLVGMRRPLPLYMTLLAHVHQVPVIGTVVGTEIPNPGAPESQKIWNEGIPYMYDAFTNVSVLNAVSTNTLHLTSKVVPANTLMDGVLIAGIDYEYYQGIPAMQPPGVEGNFIFSLRRLEPSKGIDVLIDAYARSIETGWVHDMPLVIAGDGSQMESLKAQAYSLGLSELQVRFLGSIPLEEGIGMLKAATLTVVPSRAEGGGLVNTEANAVGCPLIASDTGGIREYTSEDAAILVPPDDSVKLSEAIDSVLQDKGTQTRLRNAGKLFAASRDWSVIMPTYIELYQRAAEIKRDLRLTTDLTRKIYKVLANEL